MCNGPRELNKNPRLRFPPYSHLYLAGVKSESDETTSVQSFLAYSTIEKGSCLHRLYRTAFAIAHLSLVYFAVLHSHLAPRLSLPFSFLLNLFFHLLLTLHLTSTYISPLLRPPLQLE